MASILTQKVLAPGGGKSGLAFLAEPRSGARSSQILSSIRINQESLIRHAIKQVFYSQPH
jgi:hypothetical protein